MSPAQLRSARTIALLLAWMIFGSSVYLSSASAVSSVARDAGLHYQEWILSDINGDGISETAVSAGERYGYRLEVFLGASSGKLLLQYRSTTPVLRFFTEDIDRDNDQDIVALESFGHAQYVVWTNHGNARFDQRPTKRCLLRSEIVPEKIGIPRSAGKAEPLLQTKRRDFSALVGDSAIVTLDDQGTLPRGPGPMQVDYVSLLPVSRSPPCLIAI